MNRHFWKTIAMSALLDAVVVGVAVRAFGTDGDRISQWFFIFLAVLFVPAGFSLWGLIKFWVIFVLGSGELLRQTYRDILSAGGFPYSLPFEDGSEYLARIIDDEDEATKTRMTASYLLGELNFAKQTSAFSRGFAATLALDHVVTNRRDPVSREVS